MKNLLFLINSFVVLTMFFACSNNKNNVKPEKPQIDNNVLNIDSTKIKQNTVETNETEIKQDTLNKNIKYLNKENKIIEEAPKHNNPNQSEIDSIKKVKANSKK